MNRRAFKPDLVTPPAIAVVALPSGLERLQEILETELERTRNEQKRNASQMAPDEVRALQQLGNIYIDTCQALRTEKLAKRVGDELEGKTEAELWEIVKKGMAK